MCELCGTWARVEVLGDVNDCHRHCVLGGSEPWPLACLSDGQRDIVARYVMRLTQGTMALEGSALGGVELERLLRVARSSIDKRAAMGE